MHGQNATMPTILCKTALNKRIPSYCQFATHTLAVRLTLPVAGCVEDFHLQVCAPCRAHQPDSRLCRRLLTTFSSTPAVEQHALLATLRGRFSASCRRTSKALIG